MLACAARHRVVVDARLLQRRRPADHHACESRSASRWSMPYSISCLSSICVSASPARPGRPRAAQLLGVASRVDMVLGRRDARGAFALTSRLDCACERSCRQFKLGFPMGLLYAADILGFALFQLMQVRLGNVDGASTQIVMMLTSFCYMPAVGHRHGGHDAGRTSHRRRDIRIGHPRSATASSCYRWSTWVRSACCWRPSGHG